MYIALQPAVYAKYTAGGAFEIMASHDTKFFIAVTFKKGYKQERFQDSWRYQDDQDITD